MKIAKIVFLLVALGWGANALAAQVKCAVVTDAETGQQRRTCAYFPDFGDARRFAFISALHRQGIETTLGPNYAPFETFDVRNCEEARSKVNSEGGEWEPGFACMTQAEIESFRDEVFENLEAFNERICQDWRDETISADVTVYGVSSMVGAMCLLPAAVFAVLNSDNISPFSAVMATLWSAVASGTCGAVAYSEITKSLDENCL